MWYFIIFKHSRFSFVFPILFYNNWCTFSLLLEIIYQNVYKPNRLETPFSRSNFIHKIFKIFCNLHDLHTCWFSDSCHNLLNHSKSLEFIKMNLTPCWLFLINKHFLIAPVFDIWIIKNWMKHITSKITFMKITFFSFPFWSFALWTINVWTWFFWFMNEGFFFSWKIILFDIPTWIGERRTIR